MWDTRTLFVEWEMQKKKYRGLSTAALRAFGRDDVGWFPPMRDETAHEWDTKTVLVSAKERTTAGSSFGFTQKDKFSKLSTNN